MRPLSATAILAASFLVFGCQPEEKPAETPAPTPEPTAAKEPEPEQKPVGPNPGDPVKDGEEVAVMETDKGKIVIRFFPNKAPKTVENFKKLANEKFYEGVKFHRTITNFMIQGGDPNTKKGSPTTWGTGGPGYMIDDELNDIPHKPGILSMAHAGPNTGGSQFFLMTGMAPHLDGVHTAFGEVVEGMDVVSMIEKTPVTDGNGTVVPDKAAVIKSIKIEKWPIKK